MDLHHLVPVLPAERCPGRAARRSLVLDALFPVQGPAPGPVQIHSPDVEDGLDPPAGTSGRSPGGESSVRGPSRDLDRFVHLAIPFRRGRPLRGVPALTLALVPAAPEISRAAGSGHHRDELPHGAAGPIVGGAGGADPGPGAGSESCRRANASGRLPRRLHLHVFGRRAGGCGG